VTPQPCGTAAGYYTHRRRNEQPCQPCRSAATAATTARKKARAEAGPLPPKRKVKPWDRARFGDPLEALTPADIERFYTNLTTGPNSCLLWKGSTNNQGYGRFRIYRKDCTARLLAHRVAYFLDAEANPGPLVVRHSCDTPACCNPKHLSTGTQVDNWLDSHTRGRASAPPKNFGETHRSAKLADESVQSIRDEYAAGGCTYRSLGLKYGVNRSTIGMIVRGRNWAHVGQSA
jgi:hypothetical protein